MKGKRQPANAPGRKRLNRIQANHSSVDFEQESISRPSKSVANPLSTATPTIDSSSSASPALEAERKSPPIDNTKNSAFENPPFENRPFENPPLENTTIENTPIEVTVTVGSDPKSRSPYKARIRKQDDIIILPVSARIKEPTHDEPEEFSLFGKFKGKRNKKKSKANAKSGGLGAQIISNLTSLLSDSSTEEVNSPTAERINAHARSVGVISDSTSGNSSTQSRNSSAKGSGSTGGKFADHQSDEARILIARRTSERQLSLENGTAVSDLIDDSDFYKGRGEGNVAEVHHPGTGVQGIKEANDKAENQDRNDKVEDQQLVRNLIKNNYGDLD